MNRNHASLTPADRTRLWLKRLAWIVGALFIISLFIKSRISGYVKKSGGQEIVLTKATIRTFEFLLTTHKLLYGHYPTQEEGLEALAARSSSKTDAERLAQHMKDPWQRRIRYRIPGVHHPDSYDLFSLGPDGVEGTADDINNWESSNAENSEASP